MQGAAPTPWGKWTRQWTAEENRHGDAMNKYMYLSGRINMKVRRRHFLNLTCGLAPPCSCFCTQPSVCQ